MTQTRKQDNPMTQLYRRLADAGFNRPFIKDVVLPDWWEDEIAETPVGTSSLTAPLPMPLARFTRTDWKTSGHCSSVASKEPTSALSRFTYSGILTNKFSALTTGMKMTAGGSVWSWRLLRVSGSPMMN